MVPVVMNWRGEEEENFIGLSFRSTLAKVWC